MPKIGTPERIRAENVRVKRASTILWAMWPKMGRRIRRWSQKARPLASTFTHLHSLVSQLEQRKAQTGAQRVAEFILEFCEVEKGGCVVTLPYDKVLIAGRLGMKPESLSRAFAKLLRRTLCSSATRDVSRHQTDGAIGVAVANMGGDCIFIGVQRAVHIAQIAGMHRIVFGDFR